MANQKKLNLHTSKVIAALISSGYYEFTINRKDEYSEIDILPIILSPYTYLRVYDNGIVNYYDNSGLKFEGSTRSKNIIMMDILNK